jgi:hypothetical protein
MTRWSTSKCWKLCSSGLMPIRMPCASASVRNRQGSEGATHFLMKTLRASPPRWPCTCWLQSDPRHEHHPHQAANRRHQGLSSPGLRRQETPTIDRPYRSVFTDQDPQRTPCSSRSTRGPPHRLAKSRGLIFLHSCQKIAVDHREAAGHANNANCWCCSYWLSEGPLVGVMQESAAHRRSIRSFVGC